MRWRRGTMFGALGFTAGFGAGLVQGQWIGGAVLGVILAALLGLAGSAEPHSGGASGGWDGDLG